MKKVLLKYKEYAGFKGLLQFLLIFLLSGQLISFLPEELNGFLFVFLYFAIFPLLALGFIILNLIFFKKNKGYEILSAICLFLIYGFMLWCKPLIGSASFFVADYRELHWVIRSLILAFTLCFCGIYIHYSCKVHTKKNVFKK